MSIPAYFDIHAIQSLPFSNTNRDDLGAPKTVVFGGAERTRISSQSWKRAIRHHIESTLDDKVVRTRRVVVGVAERLQARGWEQDEADLAGIQVAISAGKGISLKQEKDDADQVVLTTNVLLLLPESSIDELADLAAEHRQAILAEGKRAKKPTAMKPVLPTDVVDGLLSRRSGTINLFGRMLAELPGANVDGAVQMAHAFTTHATQVEYDFFTAVDDVEQALKLPGSGHMNTGLFSAGTFYRYANVNLTDLTENLAGDADLARSLVAAFVDGFITRLPSGKQNATAAVTIPDLVYVCVRDDRPVSLASAFEAPVTGAHGYTALSASRLNTHAAAINTLLGEQHVLFAAHTAAPNTHRDGDTSALDGLGTHHATFSSLVEDAVAAAFPGGQA
ncbi:type I-E CRISPR-associated protein Cas7/Cse4/CasC [Saccharopolyspora thermophila]|uniref:Type I-E CRISPR-associated protein Cas7/Cse4/CasC n=1 Tax=Saccharopolyspora thermophila TaxID=89367 RepID=A0ABP3MNW2_9PSEU